MDESTPADTPTDEFTASSPEGEVEHPVPEAAAPAAPNTSLDLDGIERDLADVEVALARLDAGTYWTDEVTGEALAAELLEQHPTARRA
jgi:RNA polymerase-binding transcription factor DksA